MKKKINVNVDVSDEKDKKTFIKDINDPIEAAIEPNSGDSIRSVRKIRLSIINSIRFLCLSSLFLSALWRRSIREST